MSLRYLKLLSTHDLPYTTAVQAEIEHIATLRSAQFITAVVPSMKFDQYLGSAVVTAITPTGRTVIAMSDRDGA